VGGISFDDYPHDVQLSRFGLQPRESFRYEYDFTASWRVDIRLEEVLPRHRWRVLPVCTGGRGAAPGEEYVGALAYLQQLDRHRYGFPFEELGKVAEAMRRWLDAGGSRKALGDLEELQEACDRREINRKLRAAVAEEVAA
jgi:Plasmid pRiA4b ORF-3-like protein